MYEKSTDLALVSIGQTVTILTGRIDVSVGSLISLTACLTSGLINGDPGRVIPVAVGVLALGTLVGVLNAGLVVSRRVHPLIVTLGMGAILQCGRSEKFPTISNLDCGLRFPLTAMKLSRRIIAWMQGPSYARLQ